MPTKQAFSLPDLLLEALGALQCNAELVGRVDDVSEEVLVKIGAFGSVGSVNVAQCSLCSTTGKAVSSALSACLCKSSVSLPWCVTCHRSLLSC